MRRLMLIALLAAGCSKSPSEPVAVPATPTPAATSVALEPSGEIQIPPPTRDPFERRAEAGKLPPTRPMERAGVDYPQIRRDPFVATQGAPRPVRLSPNAADPADGARIARPERPDWKVLSVSQGRAKLSAGGETLSVKEGDFVRGCRVQSIDSEGVTVTRAGVPFRLSLR